MRRQWQSPELEVVLSAQRYRAARTVLRELEGQLVLAEVVHDPGGTMRRFPGDVGTVGVVVDWPVTSGWGYV